MDSQRRHPRTARLALGTAAVAALLTGCAGPGPAPDGRTSPASDPAAAASLGEPTELATGLEAPWGLTFLPDGSALVSGDRTRRSPVDRHGRRVRAGERRG